MSKLFSNVLRRHILNRYMCSEASLNKLRPTDSQKRILVWTKKYKTVEEVPEYISHGILEKAKSEIRIKVANILMGLTILASVYAVISGKQAAKRGDSVHQRNLDWHKDYNETAQDK